MATTYQSILIAQPNDGDVVFIRRFTRDPPVLATWDATAQQFTLANGPTLTIVGGTYAGSTLATFITNILGSGKHGWGFTASGRFIGTFESPAGTWNMQQTDFATAAYFAAGYAPPAGPHTDTIFSTFGSPAWSGPTSMSLSALGAVPLIIPAAFISAWRPQ